MFYNINQIQKEIELWLLKLSYLDPESKLFHFLFILFVLYIYEFHRFLTAYLLGIPKDILFDQYNINPIKLIRHQYTTVIVVPLLSIILGQINSAWYGLAWTKLPTHQMSVSDIKYVRLSNVFIAVSGLFVNLIFVVLSLVLFNILYKTGLTKISLRPQIDILFMYIKLFTSVHLSFVLMHLLPLPPFSGFIILRNLLPSRLANILNKAQSYPKLSFIISIYILVNYVMEPAYYIDNTICDWLGSIIIPGR